MLNLVQRYSLNNAIHYLATEAIEFGINSDSKLLKDALFKDAKLVE
jgi:hypothetical protein